MVNAVNVWTCVHKVVVGAASPTSVPLTAMTIKQAMADSQNRMRPVIVVDVRDV